MHIQLSHPSRSVDIKGPKKAKDLLRELNLVVEAHLVIRENELVTEDEMLDDKDQIEIRPVISGGSSTLPLFSHNPHSQTHRRVGIVLHLSGRDDEAVVLDPDRFNLGRELKLVSILGRVE